MIVRELDDIKQENLVLMRRAARKEDATSLRLRTKLTIKEVSDRCGISIETIMSFEWGDDISFKDVVILTSIYQKEYDAVSGFLEI